MHPLGEANAKPLFSSTFLPAPEQKAQLLELLRSNCLPREPSHFQSVIASSPADLARYDADIERFRKIAALHSRLIMDRADLQEYSDGCQSIFAPVRRLPTEILGEMFSLCAPDPIRLYMCLDSDSPADGIERTAQMHLLALSQACSSWRSVVMGTPSLWATIDVDFSPPPPKPAGLIATLTKLVSLSLKRSANYPLTIHLRALDADAGPALELLAQHSGRWRTADLQVCLPAFPYLSAAKDKLSLLERLEIGGSSLDGLDLFEAAPKLKEVSLAESGAGYSQLPWHQLHEVTYRHRFFPPEGHDANNVLQLLPHCSIYCQFNICDLDVTNLVLSDLTPVESQVCDLEVSLANAHYRGPIHCESALGRLLTSLTLPNLEDLTFNNSPIGTPLVWAPEHFSRLAARSSFRDTLCLSETPSLDSLHIEDVPANIGGITDHYLVVTDTLLQRLTWTAHPTCLVPKLEYLTFTSLFTFDDRALLDCVTSRSVACRNCLEPFCLAMYWYPPDEHKLNDSVAAGMSELTKQGALTWSLEPN
ncbi:hypothetical protein DFH09DRAFT_1145715 [Mycena vulgaris]|nr:hypothetical protein DFH09DRAFT_1145715 [Mycena vulgaris]